MAAGVLGIDPSYAKPVAWAVLSDRYQRWGDIELDHLDILFMSEDGVTTGVPYWREQCGLDMAVVEGGYVGPNPKVSLALERVRGELIAMCRLAGLRILVAPMPGWYRDSLSWAGRAPRSHDDAVVAATVRARAIVGRDLPEDQAMAVCLADWGRCQADLIETFTTGC